MKNTRYARLLAALLAIVLMLPCAPVLAEAAEEPVVITVAGPDWLGGKDWDNLYIVKAIEEKFGVQLECTPYPADAWDTQLTLMMAEDNLPDLIIEDDMTTAEYNKYGQEGYFLDLSKYLDYMPNFKAEMEGFPLLSAVSRDENGAIYGLVNYRSVPVSRIVAKSYVNNEWLERVGMPMPTTTEEFYNVLKAFKEQDANGNGDASDEIPLSMTFDDYSGVRFEFQLRTAFGIYNGNPSYLLQVDDNGKVYLAEATENWKAYLQYMNRLYSEGLLDPDCFIQTNDEYVAKITGDRLGAFSSWTQLDAIFAGADSSIFDKYNFFTGLTSEFVNEAKYPLYNPVEPMALVVVNSETKSPEKIAEILDYFYTQDGIMLSRYGVEGETFDYVTSDFGLTTVDHTGYWENSGKASVNDWLYDDVVFNVMFTFVQYNAANSFADGLTDEELDKLLATEGIPAATYRSLYMEKAARSVKGVDDYPAVSYLASETSERATLVTDITNYIKTMKAQFIIGEADFEAGWDTFIETLNDMGLERLLTIEQQAYDRYAKNL